MRIALDAMGGDFAPDPNIEGALDALERQPDLQISLVGDKEQLEKQFTDRGIADDRIQIVAAEGVVGMDEKPTEALRKKPNSSISVCWQLMAGEKVDAVVSAGNTGAVVAAGLRTRLFLKGIKRPGIAVALPTAKGRSILIDVGANPAARAEHLCQYAIMGSIYAQNVLGIDNPTIGLMNIGSEDSKGTDLYRETHQALSQGSMKDRYVGNVEGRGLYQGEADVLVCEGFVGNVVLKVSEGMAQFMLKALSEAVLSQLDVERQQAGAAFKQIGRSYQHNEEGGAPLLGIDGICIICHGSSDARAISNAIKVSTTFKDRQINTQITEALS